MTQFEQTTENVQRILKAINENECYSQEIIAKIIGISSTNVSYNIKRINTYGEIIYRNNEGKYISTETDINNIPFINIMKRMIEALKKNPTIYFWQNKYLSWYFDLNTTEIGQFRAYAEDYLKEWNIKY